MRIPTLALQMLAPVLCVVAYGSKEFSPISHVHKNKSNFSDVSGESNGLCQDTNRILNPTICLLANDGGVPFDLISYSTINLSTKYDEVFLRNSEISLVRPEPGFYGVLALGLSGVFFARRAKKPK